MSDLAAEASRDDTSQSMLRVWLAISAVWIAFWILIAAIVLATGEFAGQIGWHSRPFALILIIPPVGLLTAGTISRWTYLGLFCPGGARDQAGRRYPTQLTGIKARSRGSSRP